MSGKRLAEESQLLSEERWTIAALKKIRNQRNALKIERFQLESQLAATKCKKQTIQAAKPETVTTKPTSSEVRIDELNSELLSTFVNSLKTNPGSPEILDAYGCNFEKLDLNVTKSIFSPNNSFQYQMDMEEDDYDDDEDIDDDENITLDINMLMNADHSGGKDM